MRESIYFDRRRLIARVMVISAIALAFFSVVNWTMGAAYGLSVVEAVLCASLGLLYWRLRRGDRLDILEDVLVSWAILLLTALVLLHSIGDTGLYWVAGFPFMAYFVKDVRHARYWTLYFLVGLLALTALIAAGLLPSPYTVTELSCLVSVFLFFWLFAHIYQSRLEHHQSLLERSNRELDEQKQRMQIIMDHAPLGIWMIDANQRLQFLNRTWQEWYGISEQEACARESYLELLPESIREQAARSDGECLHGANERVYRREGYPFTDGQQHVLDIIKVRCTHQDGSIKGLVGFAIDVTDKVQADEAQKELERQMEHTQRLESLGVMAGGIAHDFNNLLTAIRGNVELARLEAELTPNLQECMASIESATHAAADLCQQMLAYSGKGILKSEPLQVKALVEEMRPLFEVSVGKHVAVRYELEEGLPTVIGDRGQIRQVLLNMVLNAGESIAPEVQGQVLLRLRRVNLEHFVENPLTGVDMPPGCYVELTVGDNGAGMGSEVLERMFEPFFTTKFTGRGLGMSAVLGILRSHGAGLEVESAPGQGTTMKVLFPCSDNADAASARPEQEHHRQMTARVLLVDDELPVVTVVKRLLVKLGMEVVTADNGRRAVEIFAANPDDFSWVLLDMTMPEMNGAECLRRLREIRPDIYVVMSSGYNAESVLLPDADNQPDHFLTKPYSYAALREAVALAVGR